MPIPRWCLHLLQSPGLLSPVSRRHTVANFYNWYHNLQHITSKSFGFTKIWANYEMRVKLLLLEAHLNAIQKPLACSRLLSWIMKPTVSFTLTWLHYKTFGRLTRSWLNENYKMTATSRSSLINIFIFGTLFRRPL